MAYRTAIHEATGCTLASLMLGRDLWLPIDLLFGCPEMLEFARTNLKVASDRMKQRYDSMAEDTPLEKGEPV